MKSNEFGALFDYLEKTASEIIVPEIIYKEVIVNYKRSLEKYSKKVMECTGRLNSMLESGLVKGHDIDINKSSAEYQKYFEKRIGLSAYNKVIPLKEEYFKSVVERAINRVKPFAENGRGFRDSLIWLSAIDIAKNAIEKAIVFISNNIKDFASPKNNLHESLKDEASKNEVDIKYYSSLAEFIRCLAVSVDFITAQWLNSVIDVEHINNESLEYIRLHKEYQILERVKSSLELEERLTGYINLLSCNLSINQFYVYEKADKSFYVNIEYCGEIESEVEVSSEEETEDDGYETRMEINPVGGNFEPIYRPCLRSKIVINNNMKPVCRDVEVTFGVIIKDKKIVKIELESVYI